MSEIKDYLEGKKDIEEIKENTSLPITERLLSSIKSNPAVTVPPSIEVIESGNNYDIIHFGIQGVGLNLRIESFDDFIELKLERFSGDGDTITHTVREPSFDQVETKVKDMIEEMRYDIAG